MQNESLIDLRRNLFNNGVIKVKNFFSSADIKSIKEAINETLQFPSPFKSTINSDSGMGEFFMDFNNWRRLPKVEEVCKDKKKVNFLKELVNSKKCWLFHDHVLVKKGKAPSTPWHHDRPYYIIKGNKNLSMWIPTSHVPSEYGMVFLAGSHKIGKVFVPSSFRSGEQLGKKQGFNELTNQVVNKFEHLSFDLELGDSLVFLNDTIHSAHPHSSDFIRSSLSIRYLMDGATLTTKYINATPPFDRLGVKIKEDGKIPENFFPQV